MKTDLKPEGANHPEIEESSGGNPFGDRPGDDSWSGTGSSGGDYLEQGTDSGSTGDPKVVSHRIYLVAPAERNFTGFFGRLIHLFQLDVFGGTLLGRRARFELGAVAFLLLVVFLFDLGAWTLLFNSILHGGLLVLDTLTLAALAFALLFATTVLIYERQFVTSDTSGGWLKVMPAMSFRALVLLVAAVVTAQPIELLLFHGPIQRRIHDEGVRSEAVKRLRELREAEKKTEKSEQSLRQVDQDLMSSFEREQFDSIQGELGEAQNKIDELEVNMERAKRNASSWKTRWQRRKEGSDRTERALASARRRGDPKEIAEAESEHTKATNWRQAAWKEHEAWIARAVGMEDELTLLRSRRDRLSEDISTRETGVLNRRQELEDKRREDLDAARSEIERIGDWITRVDRETDFSNPIYERGATEEENRQAGGFTYKHPQYDFFEQLRVLSNLRRTENPRWRGATQQERDEIGAYFGLKDIDTQDVVAWRQFEEDAKLFNFTYWIVYFIALVIPLLVIAVKLLLSRELRGYFSAAYQDVAGNPEAKAFIAADREVERGRDKKKKHRRQRRPWF